MPKRSSKKQKVEQQFARSVPDGIVPDANAPAQPAKNPAAVALGKLGGKKGGPARAAKLTAEQRQAIAKKAAATRWSAGEVG